MKTPIVFFAVAALLLSCNNESPQQQTETSEMAPLPGQSAVKDDVSKPNIVQVAAGSKDHTTLVTAVQAAGLTDALSNAGPFTVFAPTNEAFAKLPAGTVESLLKEENKEQLKGILEYHTYVGVLQESMLTENTEFEQVSGQKIKITFENGKPVINGKAHIIASIPASNGIIHVIDNVLSPQ